jgi:hypothetical protein
MIVKKLALLTALALCLGAAQAQTVQSQAQGKASSPPLASPTPQPSIWGNKHQSVEEGAWAMSVEATRHIQAEDFDWIEAKRAELFASQELDADGEPQLIWLHYGIAYGFKHLPSGERQSWALAEQSIDRWQKSRPDSLAAKLAKIAIRIDRAWQNRGGASAQTTNPAALANFKKELLLARAELDALEKFAKKDPYWFLLQGELAAPLMASEEKVGALMARAAKTYPAYHEVLSHAVLSHTPQWGGSPDSLERYARRVSAAGPAKNREIVYAKVYMSASTQGYRGIFLQTKADWPTVKAGWEKITAAHPSQSNIQSFLKMACLAVDKETARAQFKKINIETPFIGRIWTVENFKSCLHWARSP